LQESWCRKAWQFSLNVSHAEDNKDGFQLLPEDEKNFILKYGYAEADGSYLVPCDEIIYLDHSCNANTLDFDRGFDIVVRDIAKDDV
jgi:hypothetical protein